MINNVNSNCAPYWHIIMRICFFHYLPESSSTTDKGWIFKTVGYKCCLLQTAVFKQFSGLKNWLIKLSAVRSTQKAASQRVKLERLSKLCQLVLCAVLLFFWIMPYITKLRKVDHFAVIGGKVITEQMLSLAFEHVVVIYLYHKRINTV